MSVRRPGMSRRGWLLFIAMCVIWGIPYLLIRVAVSELTPATLVFFRTMPAALLLVPLAARRGHLRPVLERWRWVLAYTASELAVPWLFLSRAEQHLPSSTAGLLVAGAPLTAALIYPLVTAAATPDRRQLLGLLLGFGGVASLVGLGLRGIDLFAVAEVGITVLGYACGPLIVSRKLADLPGLGVVSASVALTALGYAPFALVNLPRHVSAQVAGAVAVLALVCTAAAFLLFFRLIAEIGPERSIVITYLNPAVAVLLGVVVLGETFTVGIGIGLPLVLVGSGLATARPASPPARPPPPGPAVPPGGSW